MMTVVELYSKVEINLSYYFVLQTDEYINYLSNPSQTNLPDDGVRQVRYQRKYIITMKLVIFTVLKFNFIFSKTLVTIWSTISGLSRVEISPKLEISLLAIFLKFFSLFFLI